MPSAGLNARKKKKLRSNFILNRVSALQKPANPLPLTQQKQQKAKSNGTISHMPILYIFHILIHDANIQNI